MLCTQDCALFVHVPVDGVNGQHGVAAHIAVPVLQARADGRHQGLQQLCFLQLAEKAQSGASDKLIWVLEVLKATRNISEMPDSPDECTYHLLPHSALPWYKFPTSPRTPHCFLKKIFPKALLPQNILKYAFMRNKTYKACRIFFWIVFFQPIPKVEVP